MKSNHLFLALATITILISCQKNNDVGSFVDLRISSVNSEYTKAVVEGGAFAPESGSIALSFFKDESAGTEYGTGTSNVPYSYSSSKWESTSPIKVGPTTGYLFAYYPYVSSANIKSLDITSSLNGTDYMYATKQSLNSTGADNVLLSMNHSLARICITFQKDASYSGAGSLSALSLSGTGIATQGKLNAVTGEISASNATFSNTGLNITVSSDGVKTECLIVPVPVTNQGAKQAVTIGCTIDGVPHLIELSDDNGVVVKGGVKSRVSLTLRNEGLSLNNVTISDWNIEDGSDSSFNIK